MSEPNPCRVITAVCRLSYPHLFRTSELSGKYQCELIFDSDDDMKNLKEAADLAKRNKWGDKPPKKLRSPFKDGDEDRPDKEGYDGKKFISPRSADRPGIVIGPNREECLDPSEVYGGCYVRASVTAFAYTHETGSGISFALNNIWKVRDGDTFSTKPSAEDDFANVDADSVGADLL